MTITAAGLAGGTGYGNATSGTRSVGSVTAGQLVVIPVGAYSSPSQAFVAGDLTKSAGTSTIGTIALDYELTDSGGQVHAAVYSFLVTGSGTLTVQLANRPSGSYFDIGSEAFNGSWDGTRVEDTSESEGNTSTAISSGDVTTAGAGLIVGVFDEMTGAASYTTDASFVDIFKDTGAPNNAGAAYRVVSSGTTDAADWTANTAVRWGSCAVAYKETAGSSSIAPGSRLSLLGVG